MIGISASISTYFAIDAGIVSLAEATGAVGALTCVVGRVAANAAAIEVVMMARNLLVKVVSFDGGEFVPVANFLHPRTHSPPSGRARSERLGAFRSAIIRRQGGQTRL